MPNVICYVDGFNFYHAVHDLGRPRLKWANLHAIAQSLVRPERDERLVGVKYFSAFATWRPDAYARHRQYVAALEATGVDVTMAHFKKKPRSCRACSHQWTDHEEKETDVRIALQILADAFDGLYDRAIIVSADSDLVPVLQAVKARLPRKTFLIACPPGRYHQARDLCKVADSYFEIRRPRIEQNLLPSTVLRVDGSVAATCPPEYA